MHFESTFQVSGFLLIIFVALVAANNRVVKMDRKWEPQLEELLEDDYLLLASRNVSHHMRKMREKYPKFDVTIAPPVMRTPHPIHTEAVLLNEEEFLPTENFMGNLLSRDKRQAAVGSGDDESSALVTFTLTESSTLSLESTATRTTRMTSVASQLRTAILRYGVEVDTVTVNDVTDDNGNTMYSITVTFSGSTDRQGLAYALERIYRDETEIRSFVIATRSRASNAADTLLNAVCQLCPAARPCTEEGICSNFSTGNIANLFEFGLSEADIKLPQEDDVTGRRIRVGGDGFPFGSTYETDLYVGSNGIVSFGTTFNPYQLDNMRSVTDKKFICIYCNDWNNRVSSGNVWYQAYPAGKDYAFNMLDRATADVRTNTQYTRFKASWVFVVTWSDVPEYNPFSSVQGSTFQMVLITDGTVSFVRYHFQNIQSSTIFRANGVHGYRTGPRNTDFYEMLYSVGRRNSYFGKPRMHTVTGNTGYPGVWLFKIGEIVTPNYAFLCLNWYQQNINMRNNFRQRALRLGSNRCPCRRNILFLTARFLPASPFTNQRVYCSEMRGSFSIDSFDCCYDRFGRFINRFPDAGSYHRFSRRLFPVRHQRQDSDPKDWCCRQSNLCSLYGLVRPRSRCFRNRRRSRFRWFFGDPHFTTLDGKNFTFNGIGEYQLAEIEPANNEFKFRVHCRTAQAVNNNNEKVRASLFSAFAAEQTSSNQSYGNATVHVGLNSDKTKMVIYFDDVDITAQFYNSSSFEKIMPQLTASKKSDTRIDFAFTQIDVVFAVQLRFGTLSQAIILPEDYEGLTKGLLGNFDGKPDNDFIFPNGTVLPSSSTDRELFPFGQAWAVPDQASSVLHYAPKETMNGFTDTNFVPLFSDEISQEDRVAATAKCGIGNEQCIYDYAVTKNENLATAANSQIQEANDNTAELENRAPELSGTSVLEFEVGQKSNLTFIGSDPDNDAITYVTVEAPTDFKLNSQSGVASYTPPSNDSFNIRIAVRDTKNAESSTVDVQVRMCPGCGSNGKCDFSESANPVKSEEDSLFQIVSCVCETGYSGDRCENDKNGCEDDPCGVGRTCTNVTAAQEAITNKTFMCSDCQSGYVLSNQSSVEKCENINECESSDPCPANSTCMDTIGSYLCSCDMGFRKNSAGRCVDIDECLEHLHNCTQTCTNTEGSYTCSCFRGYILQADRETCNNGTLPTVCDTLSCGQLCTDDDSGSAVCKCREGYELQADNKTCTNINECDRHLCAQLCNDTEGSYKCYCNAGFKLAQDNLDCERCTFPTWGDHCNNVCECMGRASECDPVQGCMCSDGWSGINCQDDVNECTTTPNICGENKRCENTNGSYSCSCENGYEANGTNCVDVNECDAITDKDVCPENSVCQNLIGSFVCNCDPGYKKDNSTCVDIDECTTGQAMCQQSCRNQVGSYNCYCDQGYTLTDDRKTCQKDPQATSPCEGLSNLQCKHYCALENNFPKCQCNRGYYLAADNITCLDVNECEDNSLNQCTVKISCVNNAGSYTCSCPAGQMIENDGRSCVACDDNHWGDGCANECSCFPLGTERCDNVKGCQCKSGWTGQTCGDDIDECSTVTCQANSDCVNLAGSYKCMCRTGFRESTDGSLCNEINECEMPADNECDHNCHDTVGSYYCTCRTGFILEGKGTCIDVDECAKETNDCQQLCRNTAGSFACECNEGYQLDSVGRKSCSQISGGNACSRTDCDSANGGCFVNGTTDTCFCNKGYKLQTDGKTCNDINECSPTKICSDSCTNSPPGSFTCTCAAGFQLATDKITCEACPPGKYGINCAQNCTCDTTNSLSCNATDGSCKCRNGWTGTTCAEDIQECTNTPNICGNNGICNEKDGTYTCTCVAGFLRSNDACTPCKSTKWGVACNNDCNCNFANTETCNAVNGKCNCKNGWMGDTCMINVDECSNPASPVCTGANEKCQDTLGSYTCGCTPGFEKNADNTACVDTNECLNAEVNNCTYQCNNNEGSFFCSCSPGYIGTGNSCTVNFETAIIIITLDSTQTATINNPSSPAFSKLKEDIGFGIDEIIQPVQAGAHLPTRVINLSEGSVVAPSEIRVDKSKTSNPDGVLAAALEKLAEVPSINVDGTATRVLNETYNGIPIIKDHTVCDVLQVIRNFSSDEYCEVGTDGIPLVRNYTDSGPNIPLIVGLSVAMFILLLLLLICIIYICCCRKRKTSERTPSEDRDVAFRSAFVGNVPTKGNFGASRYMMYSPHTLSDAGSVTSNNSSGRHPHRGGKKGPYDYDMPQWERGRAAPTTSRDYEPRVNEPTSNFSWEHLFDRLEPMRGGQFEMPRPAVSSSPSRPFRDSLA